MFSHTNRHVGKYLLLDLLGDTDRAEVYLCKDIFKGELFAVKMLKRQMIDVYRETFVEAAQVLARLSHPQIVQICEFGVEQDIPFMVTSYASGGSVRRKYQQGASLPLDIVVTYVKEIASALQYAHTQNILHQDLKPENILLQADQTILLSDFCFAEKLSTSSISDPQLSISSMPYKAPEQILGQPEKATDQYALGVIVYEWLCGASPFVGSVREIATQHLEMAPPPLQEKVPGLPPLVEQVVLIALAKDPNDRFASIGSFATALEQASL
jgi:eukaryotic-like serine/threonine-protein kinase